MLAATVTSAGFNKLQWPALASPKIDGIRCLNHPKLGPVTRSFKPVPNEYVRESLRDLLTRVPLDGELIVVGEDGEPVDFNTTQSAIMTRGGQPDFRFAVFDCFESPEDPFETRIADALSWIDTINVKRLVFVAHDIIKDEEEFMEYAEMCTANGYEGTMLRHPQGPYKSGRSTLNQGWLVKYKEWLDAEGTIVGFEERFHNANELEEDAFGLAKRSRHKENLVRTGTLGALILDTRWGELRVGSGFDDYTRDLIWMDREGYMGRSVTFKYQGFGMLDKPRFPIFLRFREQE